jgi:hypothetical protein
MVDPSTTLDVSGTPLKAATVRVVRLFAAAIDHSVSPGCTVCDTAAFAGAAAARRRSGVSARRGRAKRMA